LLRIDLASLVAAKDQERHIAGNDAHDHEYQGRDPEQRGDDQQEALRQICAHAPALMEAAIRELGRPGSVL
jgi:hypothetical protein